MPGTSDPHLKVSGVALGFDGVVLLENIDFQVERGEIFAILGGSGSGKTTLLRHMIGLDEPMRGEILVDGAPPQLGSRAPDCGRLVQSVAPVGSVDRGGNVALPLPTLTDAP